MLLSVVQRGGCQDGVNARYGIWVKVNEGLPAVTGERLDELWDEDARLKTRLAEQMINATALCSALKESFTRRVSGRAL